MGCGSSTNTKVQPLKPEEVTEEEDETGNKVEGRGDSAVSKGTTDSGVVMENREIAALPGAVPRSLPPPPVIRKSEVDRITPDEPRPKSSEILEELLNQGIIPVGQRSSTTGESYSIMLNDREVRRKPARLESLRASKMQNIPTLEEVEKKMRLVEERRKLQEEQFKKRLRAKSARFRGPVPTFRTVEDRDAALNPVEPIKHPLTPGSLNPLPHSQVTREEAEGGECVREAVGDGRECREETGPADRRGGGGMRKEGGRGGSAGRKNEDGEEEDEEEDVTQVEELKKRQFFTPSWELESDTSFQCAEDKDLVF
ncbi:uncharacterized protein V6R79_008481 [Siganus canaliculatus]